MNGIVTGKQEKQAGSLVWKSLYQHNFTWDDYQFVVDVAHIQNDLYFKGLLYAKFISAIQSPANMSPIYMPVFSMGLSEASTKIFANFATDKYVTTFIGNYQSGTLTILPADNDNPIVQYLTSMEIGTFE